jgi:hypothetical protein
MMLQTHIGYTTWRDPKTNIMPALVRVPGTAAAPNFAGPTLQADGVVAIEAPAFSRSVGGKGLRWAVIPHLGRTEGAVIALPQGAAPTSQADAVRLEYDVALPKAGDVTLQLSLVPTLDTIGSSGLKLGVSLDDGPMQTLSFNLIPSADPAQSVEKKAWEAAVSNNAHLLSAGFATVAAGKHTVKIWRLDDNVVLQKLVIASGPIPPSYLGPQPK